MADEKSNNKLWIVVILLLCGACIYAGSQMFPKTITNIQYDTTYVEKIIKVPIEKIVYRRLPAQIETVKVNNETIADIIAKVDTTVTTISAESLAYKDSVHVAYHFPPLNYFDVSLGLQPRLEKIHEVYITKTIEVEKSKMFDFSVGGLLKDIGLVAGGYLLCKLTDKNEVQYYPIGRATWKIPLK